MIKVLVYVIVLILCWPIALVVGAIWLLVAIASACCGAATAIRAKTPTDDASKPVFLR